MHCGNKTFMGLGILTQCHFPSLTWKECTSHNRLHHPAIKPCQGTTFLAALGQLWRERSTQTHTLSTEGPPLLPQPYPATPCSWTWTLTLALWPACEACVTLELLQSHTLCRALCCSPLNRHLGRSQSSFFLLQLLLKVLCFKRRDAFSWSSIPAWTEVCFDFPPLFVLNCF